MVMSQVEMIYEMNHLIARFRSAYYDQLNPGPNLDLHFSASEKCQLIAKQVHTLVNLPDAPANFAALDEGRSSVDAMRMALQKYYHDMLPEWRAEYDLKKTTTSS
jgi:hypothetical protein